MNRGLLNLHNRFVDVNVFKQVSSSRKMQRLFKNYISNFKMTYRKPERTDLMPYKQNNIR